MASLVGIVVLKQSAGFRQGKAQTLAAQNKFQSDSVLETVDTGLATTPGFEQPLIFIEADAAGGDIKFL